MTIIKRTREVRVIHPYVPIHTPKRELRRVFTLSHPPLLSSTLHLNPTHSNPVANKKWTLKYNCYPPTHSDGPHSPPKQKKKPTQPGLKVYRGWVLPTHSDGPHPRSDLNNKIQLPLSLPVLFLSPWNEICGQPTQAFMCCFQYRHGSTTLRFLSHRSFSPTPVYETLPNSVRIGVVLHSRTICPHRLQIKARYPSSLFLSPFKFSFSLLLSVFWVGFCLFWFSVCGCSCSTIPHRSYLGSIWIYHQGSISCLFAGGFGIIAETRINYVLPVKLLLLMKDAPILCVF